MPFKSDRAALINELEQLLRLTIADDADNTSDFEEIMDIYVAVTGSRYLNERSYCVPKSGALVDIIMQFSDREFKVIARCDWLIRLVKMIEDHPVFDRTSRHKQSPVWLQLLVVLNRLGCDGNGASIQRTAMLNGISYGSVKKFTERVFTAIRRSFKVKKRDLRNFSGRL